MLAGWLGSMKILSGWSDRTTLIGPSAFTEWNFSSRQIYNQLQGFNSTILAFLSASSILEIRAALARVPMKLEGVLSSQGSD